MFYFIFLCFPIVTVSVLILN
uniref:Uncharacterized protein n=1 Tax=Rhizophora mucronata TaxID=61149 RepID=A0A2P2NA20_RHIMU